MKPGRTLVQVSEHLGLTHGQLSKIENGKSPYSQDLLEALADLYACDVVDILTRDPSAPEDIWKFWRDANERERRQMVDMAKVILSRTGTDG